MLFGTVFLNHDEEDSLIMRIFRSTCGRIALGAAATVATASLVAPSATAQETANAPEAAQAPKNIILLIGDGMGYNHVDSASLFENGESNWQISVDPENDQQQHQSDYGDNPQQSYEEFDLQIGMSHHSLDSPVYDPEAAWADFDWVKNNPTDSAASGTALASGHKTHNGSLGVDDDGEPVENFAEYAAEKGLATGVVSSVPFGHATPASWGAHVADRGENHAIAEQMINGELDVIIGAGHPLYDVDGQEREANWKWLTEEQYTDLQEGNTDFTFLETTAELKDVANGNNVPESLFGLVPVAETLQFDRTALAEAEPRRDNGRVDGVPLEEGQSPLPGEIAKNDVPTLAELTDAALNVLEQNDEGFFTMIEGGAIDWAGHANATTGNLEEQIEFNDAVDTVVNWVEENSSWDETLVMVTADHETGFLSGPGAGTAWTQITGEAGQLPVGGWYSGDHTQALVPFFAHGAGADSVLNYVQGEDPVRGQYIDNTDVAKLSFDLLSGEAAPGPGAGDDDEEAPGSDDDDAQTPGSDDEDGTAGSDEDEEGTAGAGTEDGVAGSGDDVAAGDSEQSGSLADTGTSVAIIALLIAGALLVAGVTLMVLRKKKTA
ncbi:alkaline phosphatase [Auritidibacter ignavus]|uniref:alkaline phosphatase n=2 Tax=Auritidibacter ignavus TaxID=678932 RepID=UPI0024471E5B|nr:alkaline phosphatase [Auritidibacter ignavus]WGH88050.1 alkaline phosphatase [Auritidibacter ignavus]